MRNLCKDPAIPSTIKRQKHFHIDIYYAAQSKKKIASSGWGTTCISGRMPVLYANAIVARAPIALNVLSAFVPFNE
jgi:hypothetical protein